MTTTVYQALGFDRTTGRFLTNAIPVLRVTAAFIYLGGAYRGYRLLRGHLEQDGYAHTLQRRPTVVYTESGERVKGHQTGGCGYKFYVTPEAAEAGWRLWQTRRRRGTTSLGDQDDSEE